MTYNALILGLGIALVGTLPAKAELIIRANGATVASSSNNDVATFLGSVGTFNVNLVATFGVDLFSGNGTLMDNASVNVSSTGVGTLLLEFIQTDLASASASLAFGMSFTGNIVGAAVVRSFYADATNAGLTATLLGTTTLGNATIASAPVALGGPFSLTEVISITALQPGAFLSADDAVSVPEPAALALFGAGLLGLGLAWRRRAPVPLQARPGVRRGC